MWSRYNSFLLEPPHLTLSWQDPETEARGWLVINSLRGGAAGGGTRMRIGANVREAGYLAKTMELKFALAGPPIGGAKSAIDFDPDDPRKVGVLERWFAAIGPYLSERYGTGGDLNVDEVAEVVPMVQALGVEHPQAGVVRGHLRPDPAAFQGIIAGLRAGAEAPIPPGLGISGKDLAVVDMITGYGVSRAVIGYRERVGRPLEGARVVIEGFGNVGTATALYLARAGARIVAISDATKTLVEPRGMNAPEVERLIREGPYRLLPADPRCQPRDPRVGALRVPAEIFVCAASSGTLTDARLDQLVEAGVQIVASGANQPFREREPGSTRVHQLADGRFAVLMDCLANLGKARTFSYLMEGPQERHAAAIFAAVDDSVSTVVAETLARASRPDRGLMAATLALALDRIGVA
jgi:glutamate dehydrogenase/leucine dehydrogenase